jgi:hypothetical protein
MTPGVIDLFEGTESDIHQQLLSKDHKPHARAEIKAALGKAILPCKELAALGIPLREPLLGDWFLEGDLGFIFAPRGLGKTWLALAMAAAIATGGKCGPWTASKAWRVLYIDGGTPCGSLCERIDGLNGDDKLSVLNHEALFHLSGRQGVERRRSCDAGRAHRVYARSRRKGALSGQPELPFLRCEGKRRGRVGGSPTVVPCTSAS